VPVPIIWRKRDRELRARLTAGGDLSGQDFSRARLDVLKLRGADLAGADLHGADLTGTDLRSASLRDANMRGACLTGAQLNGANLSGADLRDAYLLMTDFGDATLADVRFTGAVWDQSTQWPAGFDPPYAKVGYWHGIQNDE
jgi:uncharacterized protein YjbI with pentapeptide repeats